MSCALPITNTDEVLYRQAHPEYIQNGLSALIFRPGTNDNGELSVRRAQTLTARQAYEEHTAQNRKSAGTFQITVGEANDAGLVVYDDASCVGIPGHAYIDFKGLAPSERKQKRNILLKDTIKHSIAYEPCRYTSDTLF